MRLFVENFTSCGLIYFELTLPDSKPIYIFPEFSKIGISWDKSKSRGTLLLKAKKKIKPNIQRNECILHMISAE